MKKISLVPLMLAINPSAAADMYYDKNNWIITVIGRR